MHYSGDSDGPCEGYGIEMRHFESQCERMQLCAPHLASARVQLLDYFRSVSMHVPHEHLIFRFERSMELSQGERALLGQLCTQFALPRTDAAGCASNQRLGTSPNIAEISQTQHDLAAR